MLNRIKLAYLHWRIRRIQKRIENERAKQPRRNDVFRRDQVQAR